MGTVIVLKLETEEDYEKLVEFAGKILEFFAENALEHERIGETMDRIGLPAFLEAIGRTIVKAMSDQWGEAFDAEAGWSRLSMLPTALFRQYVFRR
jgi:dissimilatory sulfite reductase (desulfoviridin) alpha/beta subunit